MTEFTEHIAFDALNDYVDGLLAPAARREVDRHVVVCASCAAQFDELRRVLAIVAAAPAEIMPEGDLWAEVRPELEKRKELVLPTAGRGAAGGAGGSSGSPRGGWRPAAWRQRAMLAAAAVILVVLSSAITAAFLRRGSDQSAEVGPRDGPRGSFAPTVLLAGFRVAEDEYLRTIGELRSAVEAQRDHLSPETIATVERSLVVIDAAIDEARAALVGDPGNQTLVDLLSASYERKLELLRRASELPARS